MAIKQTFTLVSLLFLTSCIPRGDLVTIVPGYGDDFQTHVYSGYLNLTDTSRKIHYVFVESVNGAKNTDPVTVWLNGGPGCSSLLGKSILTKGYLQQIGPYYLEEGVNYTAGMNLTKNDYSWHKVSNLLFLESPAGVGYSINTNESFAYNDLTTLKDNFEALQFFFANAPEYKNNPLWIAGESYAGKYIPDLAARIDRFNIEAKQDQKFNLKGVLIGNGVIDFTDDSLDKSTIEYFIDHDFLDPETLEYWTRACQHDEQSAGCQYFLDRADQTLEDINPYNIYSECYYNDTTFTSSATNDKKQYLSQQSILRKLAKGNKQPGSARFNGAPCAYFEGLSSYFNTHYEKYHAQLRENFTTKWNGPCAEDISQKYKISTSGSLPELSYLLTRQDLQIVLYNGDWDGVVPFGDTLKNFQKLKLTHINAFYPIPLDDQHIGFSMNLNGLTFITIKGASHQVPQSKRKESLYLFKSLLESEAGQPIAFK